MNVAMQNDVQEEITILIVDDNSRDRKVLRTLLQVLGYNLVFADDGPEALTKAAELRPDMILLDVMMPEMDGFEVCRQLRADPLLAEVPIIMVTALDDQASRSQGLKVGADDFISKPFDWTKLRIRIQVITRINRYVAFRHQLEKKGEVKNHSFQSDDPIC